MLKKAFLFLIKIYQFIFSPDQGIFFRRNVCRFYPTCSQYAYEAIDIHGALKGSFLAIKRILRCHPFNQGGYDPVPLPRIIGIKTKLI